MRRVSVVQTLAATAACSLLFHVQAASAQTPQPAQPKPEQSKEDSYSTRTLPSEQSPGGIADDSDIMLSRPGGCPEWPNCPDGSGAAASGTESCPEGSKCPEKE